MQDLFAKIMELITRNSKISILQDKELEAEWIDEVSEYIVSDLKPKITEVFEKLTVNEPMKTNMFKTNAISGEHFKRGVK